MVLVLAPEPDAKAGVLRGRCAAAGAGQGVDLRPRVLPPAKHKIHKSAGSSHGSCHGSAHDISVDEAGLEPELSDASDASDASDKGVFTRCLTVLDFLDIMERTCGRAVKGKDTGAAQVGRTCRAALRLAQELWHWHSVPTRTTAHTLRAATACVDFALAYLHYLMVFKEPPAQDKCLPDYSVVGDAVAAAVAEGSLPPPPPSAAAGDSAGDLAAHQLDFFRRLAREAMLADAAAWQASPWACCGPTISTEYIPCNEARKAAAMSAISARFSVLETLVTVEVLEAARKLCRDFMECTIADLAASIAQQLAVKGKRFAVFTHYEYRGCVKLTKAPTAAVFEPVLVHGLLWPEMPGSAYPSWFPERYSGKLDTMLAHMQYLFVRNDSKAVPPSVHGLSPRLLPPPLARS